MGRRTAGTYGEHAGIGTANRFTRTDIYSCIGVCARHLFEEGASGRPPTGQNANPKAARLSLGRDANGWTR